MGADLTFKKKPDPYQGSTPKPNRKIILIWTNFAFQTVRHIMEKKLRGSAIASDFTQVCSYNFDYSTSKPHITLEKYL